MAMAATIIDDIPISEGDSRLVIFSLAVTGTYPTGGEVPTGLKMERIRILKLTDRKGSGYLDDFDTVNQKIKLFNSNGAAPAKLAETANAEVHTALNGSIGYAIGQ
jgi:hypothetical protein